MPGGIKYRNFIGRFKSIDDLPPNQPVGFLAYVINDGFYKSDGTSWTPYTVNSAAEAIKLTTPRTISLAGPVTGSTTFDGSADASITTTSAFLGKFNTVTDLPTTAADGDVAYLINSDTLVQWTGTRWQPINRDHREGFTLVNLVGTNGNYPVDFGPTASTTYTSNIPESYGFYWNSGAVAAETVTSSASTNILSITTSANSSITLQTQKTNGQFWHKYFGAVLIKSDVAFSPTFGIASVDNYATHTNMLKYGYPSITTNFQRVYYSGTSNNISINLKYILLYIYQVPASTTVYLTQYCIYDLTDMGQLPWSLVAKYGAMNWTDLTDDQLAAELPYVDGAAWVEVQS